MLIKMTFLENHEAVSRMFTTTSCSVIHVWFSFMFMSVEFQGGHVSINQAVSLKTFHLTCHLMHAKQLLMPNKLTLVSLKSTIVFRINHERGLRSVLFAVTKHLFLV